MSHIEQAFVEAQGHVLLPLLAKEMKPESINPVITLTGRDDPARAQLETFIWKSFHKQYEANVSQFMPWLLTLSCERDRAADKASCTAVLGYRHAQGVDLFLEQYLDHPLEHYLAAIAGAPVSRSDVVEVGNLAADRRVGSSLLFLALMMHLRSAGIEWVCCTITPTVSNIFKRLGIPFRELVQAEGERLGEKREQWGKYYDRRITVQYARVSETYPLMIAHPVYGPIIAQIADKIPACQLSSQG